MSRVPPAPVLPISLWHPHSPRCSGCKLVLLFPFPLYIHQQVLAAAFPPISPLPARSPSCTYCPLWSILHSQPETFIKTNQATGVPAPKGLLTWMPCTRLRPQKPPVPTLAHAELVLDSGPWHCLCSLPETLTSAHLPPAFPSLLLSPRPSLCLHATSSERYALTATAKGTCSVTFRRLLSFSGTRVFLPGTRR